MEELATRFESLGIEIALYGPRLLGVAMLLGAGVALTWTLGRVAPGLAARLRLGQVPGVASFDAMLQQAGSSATAGTVTLRALQAGVLITALAQAARFADLETLGVVMTRASEIVPMILIALAILVFGIALSDKLAALAAGAAARSGTIAPGLASILIRVVTLAITVALALEAAGIAVDLPVVVLGISLAAALALLVVSLIIGARGLFENLLAARYVEEHYIEGQVIEFRNETAVVAEIGMLATAIQTASDQERIVPNAIFMREVF